MPVRHVVAAVACALSLGWSPPAGGAIPPPDSPAPVVRADRTPGEKLGIVPGPRGKCGAVRPVLVGAAEKVGAWTIRARKGARFRLVFKSQYDTCAGTVAVKEGKRTLGKVKFRDRRAEFRFPSNMEPGKHRMTVAFRGHKLKLTVRIVRS